MLTSKQMSGLVNVRYWGALMIWRNRVGSENKGSDSMINLEVEIRVSTSLQEIIPARVKMSSVYLYCHNIKPIPMDRISMPKKKWTMPKSQSLNSELSNCIKINKRVSTLKTQKLIESRKSLKRVYQARETCFKPFRNLYNWHIWEGRAESTHYQKIYEYKRNYRQKYFVGIFEW
jgi:hypothetical protein